MNRLLIGILDIVNRLVALLIIVSATVEGYRGEFAGSVFVEPQGVAQQALWTVLGFILGLALAGIVSGFIAAIVTIAREVAALRELMAVRVWTNPPHP
jgi:hypothetical protein